MSILGLFIWLVVFGVLLYLVQLIPMNGTVKQIITVLAILFLVLWILEGFGVIGPWHVGPPPYRIR